MTTMTPYAAAKLVNAQLEELALPTIPPQMIYNYVKSGRIASEKSAIGDGKPRVTEAALAEWFVSYLQRKAQKSAKLVTAIAAVTDEPAVDENQISLFEIDAK